MEQLISVAATTLKTTPLGFRHLIRKSKFFSPRAESRLYCISSAILSPAIGPGNESQRTSACGNQRPHVPSQLCGADSKDAAGVILMDKKKAQVPRSGFARFWIR